MVLRHSGRVGSRRFTELLRNNQVPEEFFCYVRPAESHRMDALHPAPEAVRTDEQLPNALKSLRGIFGDGWLFPMMSGDIPVR